MMKAISSLVAVVLLAPISLSVDAQRSGQSIIISQGIVTGARATQVSSNADRSLRPH